jgi:hypothetical protein
MDAAFWPVRSVVWGVVLLGTFYLLAFSVLFVVVFGRIEMAGAVFSFGCF